jgi:hypothetical protein
MKLLFTFAKAFGDQMFVGPIGTLKIIDNKHKINTGECNICDLENIE